MRGMAAAYDPAVSHASEWKLWPGRENVTLRKQTAVGVYTAHSLTATGGAAKRRALTFKEVASSAGAYTGQDRAWLIPQANLPAGVVPAPGDQVRDAAGVDWTVGDVTVGKFGQTHKCVCRALAIVSALSATGVLSRPDNTQDATGRMALANYSDVGTVACRVQPGASDATDVMQRRTTPRHYTAFLATPLTPRAKDRFVVGGVTYTVLGYKDPEKIWDLMSLELELVG